MKVLIAAAIFGISCGMYGCSNEAKFAGRPMAAAGAPAAPASSPGAAIQTAADANAEVVTPAVVKPPAVVVTAPTISYSVNPYTAVISTTLTGTPLQSCTASPTLPSGLSINPSNCVISGTPTVSVGDRYTITATNAGGTGTASVIIILCSANSTWNGTICACNTGFTIVNKEWTCQGQAIPFSSNAADGWVDVTTTGPTLTLKDTRTGLKWTNRQPNKLEPQDAINHCNNLTYNGVNGWRLPSNAELVAAAYNGILGAGRTNWITINELRVSGSYGSTSSRLNGTYYSGNVSLAYGYVGDRYKSSDGFSVICVQ